MEAHGTALPRPPRSIVVFGVLNLIFGLMGLLGSVMTFILFAAAAAGGDEIPNPTFDAMQRSAVFKNWSYFVLVAGFLASIVLVLSGVGLLRRMDFGRRWAIYYAYYALVMAVASIVMNVIYVFVPLFSQFDQEAPVMVLAIVGAVFGTVLALLYPALILLFMNKPAVIAALDQRTNSFDA